MTASEKKPQGDDDDGKLSKISKQSPVHLKKEMTKSQFHPLKKAKRNEIEK